MLDFHAADVGDVLAGTDGVGGAESGSASLEHGEEGSLIGTGGGAANLEGAGPVVVAGDWAGGIVGEGNLGDDGRLALGVGEGDQDVGVVFLQVTLAGWCCRICAWPEAGAKSRRRRS
jgi:hypothetical protein